MGPHCGRGAPVATLASLLTILFAGFVITGDEPATAKQSGSPECAPRVDFLGFSDALDKQEFEGTAVGGLSALTYAGGGPKDIYYSLVDNGPDEDSPARFYTVEAPLDRSGLGTPEMDDVTFLRDASGDLFRASNFDGEGIEVERDGNLLAASETEPSIRRFSQSGELLDELAVPRKFLVAPEGGGRTNLTFESLSLSPNGRSLFTANEGFLAPDGETAGGSDRIRLLRYEDRGPGGFEPAEEAYYLAEPDQGVVEVLAVSEEELLVLERGFVAGEGNTVRVFRVSLDDARDVSGEPSLAAPDLAPVEKDLVVDLADCPSSGAESPGDQKNPLLDNYESLEFGPRIAGGGRSLLFMSDDNFNDAQVTRVLALGLESESSREGSQIPREPSEPG